MFSNFVQFVREIYNSEEFISLHAPIFSGKEREYVMDTINSTFVSSVGEYVTKFEKEIAMYTGSRYAIATVSGTAALHLALLTSGLRPGDEVLTQSLTFVATCNAISYCVAAPIFIDVDSDTLGICPDSLESFLVR